MIPIDTIDSRDKLVRVVQQSQLPTEIIKHLAADLRARVVPPGILYRFRASHFKDGERLRVSIEIDPVEERYMKDDKSEPQR